VPEARDDIPAEKVEYLAYIGCTVKEIAEFYECTDRTIRNRFSEKLAKGRAKRKQDLREAQWKSAITSGNITMQIWLGKQELGQSEFGASVTDEELTNYEQ